MAAPRAGRFAGSDVVLQQPDTVLFRGSEQLGAGLLSVDESYLHWESEDKSCSVALEYPSIPIHAISSDTSSFPHQCVYLLHTPVKESEEEEDESDEEGELDELRLIPPDPSQLEPIYSAISECQLLYPGPEDTDSEEEEEEEEEMEEEEKEEMEEEKEKEEEEEEEDSGVSYYTSAEEGLPQLTTEGRAVLEHLESVFHVTVPSEFSKMVEGDDHHVSQFEDAD